MTLVTVFALIGYKIGIVDLLSEEDYLDFLFPLAF